MWGHSCSLCTGDMGPWLPSMCHVCHSCGLHAMCVMVTDAVCQVMVTGAACQVMVVGAIIAPHVS